MDNDQQQMTVGLVLPALVGHTTRGTGAYAKELASALQNVPGITVKQIPRAADAHACDLIHYPSFDPFFLTLPLYKQKPTIVTVHDLIPLRYPQEFYPGIRGKIKWQIQRRSLRGAAAIITDSRSSAEDVITYTGISQDLISVVYLGVSSIFQQLQTSALVEKTIKKFGLPEQFILHVGDVNYNKNIPMLLQAMEMINQSGSPLHLVCVGKGFTTPSKELSSLQHQIHEHHLGKTVSFLGYVTQEELIHLYNAAVCYVQPSLAEGFGLPVLEAMACGCPTVISNTTSMREIAYAEAQMVTPTNINSLAGGITKVAQNKQLQESLRAKGLEHVKQFTWKKTAQQTVLVYRRVLGQIL